MSHSGKGAKAVKAKGGKNKGKGSTSGLKGVTKPKPKKPTRVMPGRKGKLVRFVANPVLPCDVAKLLKGRPDKLLLQNHLLAIEAHRQKYQNRLDRAKAKQAKGDASEVHAMPAHMAKITEATGEREATLLMVQEFVRSKVGATYALKRGFSAGTGIDQIWYSLSKDTFMVVEAKGPGATLSTNAAKGDQMSKQWVRASLEEAKNSPSTGTEEKKMARRMLNAMDNGPPPEVRGAVIEALPGGGAKVVACPDKGIYHAT
jgi:hypothetical protein